MAKKLVAFRLSEDVVLLLGEVAKSYSDKTAALEDLIRIGVKSRQVAQKQGETYARSVIQLKELRK